MIKIPLQNSTRWLTGAAAGLATFGSGPQLAGAPWADVSDSIRRAAALERFRGGYEGVLGTSLDVIVEAARPSDAVECEARLLGEIERLRRILSTYDSASEIRRVMAGAPVESAELAELLAAYERWAARTGGLIDVNLGGVIGEWREAARTGRLPERATLERAARRARAFNVDALGKSFIIDRAVAVARRFAPGGLVNLGGDLRAWGDTAWPIRVADPRNPADNAPPFAHFSLRDGAVATSGGYARFFEVGGKRFSHLIDPRTQWPLEANGGATVVARDAVTANALSTAASIVGAPAGADLAQAHGATGFLLADAAGGVTSGGTLAAAPVSPAPKSSDDKPAVAAAPWPAGFQVNVQVALKKIEGSRRIFRPYVAVWILDAHRYIVRTVAVWGDDPRYQRKLNSWWNQPRNGGDEPASVARATRAAGAYAVVWDGKDDFGRSLPAGVYTVCLEVCREDGHHIAEAVSLNCGEEPATAAFRETVETDASVVTYGPVKS